MSLPLLCFLSFIDVVTCCRQSSQFIPSVVKSKSNSKSKSSLRLYVWILYHFVNKAAHGFFTTLAFSGLNFNRKS